MNPAKALNPGVGAGLLAKAVGLPALMLDVPTSSRAGSLPQGFAVGINRVNAREQMWERARSR
ncbi:hypothetical protein FGE05_04170 [Pseudomonas sp. ICMP22404]|nr:hypothetical protein FGE05_04170 [Pseudomonas sp. ICMP22404]